MFLNFWPSEQVDEKGKQFRYCFFGFFFIFGPICNGLQKDRLEKAKRGRDTHAFLLLPIDLFFSEAVFTT